LESAAIVGVNPDPFTLRELLIMAEAKQRAAWNHTAQLAAIWANIHRGPKTPAFDLYDFHPYMEKPNRHGRGGIPIDAANINLLKAAFSSKN